MDIFHVCLESKIFTDIKSNAFFVVSNCFCFNPNAQKSYKFLQSLYPKHAASGAVQSPYLIYSHGKACLFKQLPWRAAGDPRLPHGRSRVPALAPMGALRVLFFSTLPPSLPPFLPSSFFCTIPTNPMKVLGLFVHHLLGLTYPNAQKSYRNYLQNTQQVVLFNSPTLS